MKTVQILGALLLVATFGFPSCSGESSKSGKAEVYQCPMECEGDKTYDAPGQCPVCNMDLTIIEE